VGRVWLGRAEGKGIGVREGGMWFDGLESGCLGVKNFDI